MSWYNPGDKVRIIIEGEVSDVRSWGVQLKGYGTLCTEADQGTTVKVEVVERLVTTFKPGDRVRNKGTGNEYTLGVGGFFSHQKYEWTNSNRDFTSKAFELA